MTNEYQPVTIPGRSDIRAQSVLADGKIEYQIVNNGLAEGGYIATNGKTLEHIELDVRPAKRSWHGDIAESMMAESPVVYLAQTPGYVAQGGKEKVFSLDAVDELVSEIVTARQQLAEANEARKRTQNWYAGRYGKLHDWARKMLPEPYLTQFFSCVANGLYDATKDIGKTYRCVAGFDVTPSGYFVMDSASQQILHEQSIRAENAELKLAEAQAENAALKAQVERMQAPVSDEELEQLCSAKGIRAPTNAIIAARAAEEGTKTTPPSRGSEDAERVTL